MTTTIPPLTWNTLKNWQTTGFVGLSKATGLFRFRDYETTMFLGYGATPKSSIGDRIGAYRRGAAHFAGEHIFEELEDLDLQICLLDRPPHEIRRIHTVLIERRRPPFNVPGGHRRR